MGGHVLWLVLQFACCALFAINAVEIKIGALFDDNVNDTELMLRFAVRSINGQQDEELGLRIDEMHVEIPYGNEFAASRRLCRFMKNGVTAIFGPTAPSASTHCMNICDAKEIPYIDFRWDAETRPPVINMMPHPNAMANVFVDLIRAWEWKGFTILYETAPWLPRVSELLKLYNPKEYTITVRRMNLGLANNNYRSVLRRVKLSEELHLVIDCSIDALPEVLKQAQQVGLMTDQHQIIITSIDMHTIDLEPYQYSGTNITGVRLVDPENPLMLKVSQFINETMSEKEEEIVDGLQPDRMRTQTALVYDAVLLLTESLKQLDAGEQEMADKLSPPRGLTCGNLETWEHGNSITNFMRNTITQGLTGEIKFDNEGLRTLFNLDVVELKSSGLEKVGNWHQETGLNMSRMSLASSTDEGTLSNRSFIVITALSPPYGMLKDSANKLNGNDRYEGFGIDLIHELSLLLGFNYTFTLQEDKEYGSYNNETNQWNGMIRELHDFRADLAITDLTITSEREGGVDFTMPFMNLGISILFRKPTKQPPSTFSFMSPFSTEVWIYLGMSYLGVSLCLFVLGRISPSEWDNPYPCIEEPTELENQFSLCNSMWFTIGALLQQGSEIAPKAPSTRVVASIWWFFTLIMVSSYTANLAAFLTVVSVASPLSSAEQLKDCHKSPQTCPVEFGAKRGGSTLNFFKDAEHATYKNMYEYMMKHPHLMTKDNQQGEQIASEDRPRGKNYAFLMESSSIEYIIERNCEVSQVGGLLDEKGYGIAMRKNSPYRSALSGAVLRLQEQGKLTKLKNKWWKEKKGGGACTDTSSSDSALSLDVANLKGVFLLLCYGCFIAAFCCFIEAMIGMVRKTSMNKKKASGEVSKLDMDNMYGVFIVLMIGSAAASLFGFVEWLLIMYFKAKKYKIPFKDEFFAELRFVIMCQGNTKTVRHRKSESIESTRRSHSSDRSCVEQSLPKEGKF